ncbi:hypothetical protein [Gemmatimonas sp.]|uniref:hypothetical protein n=1 Tax=Gemmatimonas sp. TaxID=1962908 RepID=UPI0035664C21
MVSLDHVAEDHHIHVAVEQRHTIAKLHALDLRKPADPEVFAEMMIESGALHGVQFPITGVLLHRQRLSSDSRQAHVATGEAHLRQGE